MLFHICFLLGWYKVILHVALPMTHFPKSSRNKKDFNDVTAALFSVSFSQLLAAKKHQKWGSCDVIKVFLISWWLSFQLIEESKQHTAYCPKNTYFVGLLWTSTHPILPLRTFFLLEFKFYLKDRKNKKRQFSKYMYFPLKFKKSRFFGLLATFAIWVTITIHIKGAP